MASEHEEIAPACQSDSMHSQIADYCVSASRLKLRLKAVVT